MCFEVPALVPTGGPAINKKGAKDRDDDDDDLGIMDPDGNDVKPGTLISYNAPHPLPPTTQKEKKGRMFPFLSFNKHFSRLL